MRPNCPKCATPNPKKSGHVLGRQRWKCKACGYEFTRLQTPGKSQNLKRRVAQFYEAGFSSTQVGVMMNVSPTSVLKWARMYTPACGRVHQLTPRLVFPAAMRAVWKALHAKKFEIAHKAMLYQLGEK